MKKRKTTNRRRKDSDTLVLALLPTRDLVALPGLIIPIHVTEPKSADAVNFALATNEMVGLTLQRGAKHERPNRNNLCEIGSYAKIAHSIRLPNGELRIRLHVQGRMRIKSFLSTSPFPKVRAETLDDKTTMSLNLEQQKMVEAIKERFGALSTFDPNVEDLVYTAQDLYDPGALADLIGSALPLEGPEAQRLLEELKPLKRLQLVRRFLNSHIDQAAIKERISKTAEQELGRAQHEQLLREQLRQIQVELGDEDDFAGELSDLKKQIDSLKLPPHARDEAKKQLRRLEQLHPDTSEAALARTYLDTVLELPWSKRTKDLLDIETAKKVLNEDHFGLEKTKERILDFLGVRMLKKGARGPILLLVGPPGVGKTSLGRSIARALGRQFARVSLGGLRDEAELRGHRRTYVGALPGRIIQSLNSAGSKNPVLMLDEIDKVGADFRGDPASVLLEILDAEQNKSFEDHYLNIPFDLSEVMFVCTANITDTIPPPLLDRMEVIEIAGYTTEEKLQIAKRYIVPREREENGLGKIKVDFTEEAIFHIIDCYTRESGVRELGRTIGTVLRKLARMIAEGDRPPKKITPKLIEAQLGPIRFVPDRRLKRDEVGVVTGLAWTSTGGEIMTIEASMTKGKGTLSLTGQMGEVMRESAMAALTYVLSNTERFGLDQGLYEQSNVHVHVPQGAIPKDGPSAGIAIATALVSLFTNRAISRNVAMTGEITLRGNVLPIGGLKEKALAALRVGIDTVIIPKENERELVEFPDYLRKKVHFVSASTIEEVLDRALLLDKRTPEPTVSRHLPRSVVSKVERL